jgi:hypothetical protein
VTKPNWWLEQAGLSFPHVLAVFAAHEFKEDIGELYQAMTAEELVKCTEGSLEKTEIGRVICRKLDIINLLPGFIQTSTIGIMMWQFMEDLPHQSNERINQIIYEKIGTLAKESSWWATNKTKIYSLAQRTNKTKKLLES